MSGNDFRVEQTYDEIRQYVEDAAISVLTWHGEYEPPPTDSEQQWAERMARRIAEGAVRNLDAAEDV